MQLTYIDLDRRVAQYRSQRWVAPRNWDALQKRLALSWLYHDHALEGIALQPEDIHRALHNQPARHHCDGLLLKKIRQNMAGFESTTKALRDGLVLDLEGVKQFHVFLCKEGAAPAGRYRKHEGPIAPYTHELTHPPSISYRLRKLVDNLENLYPTMHPVRAAALLHHEFMAIWPFDGRSATAGRLLLNFWLMSAGYPPAIIHGMDRQSYYNALEGEPEAMIPVIVNALEGTLRCAESFFSQRESRIA